MQSILTTKIQYLVADQVIPALFSGFNTATRSYRQLISKSSVQNNINNNIVRKVVIHVVPCLVLRFFSTPCTHLNPAQERSAIFFLNKRKGRHSTKVRPFWNIFTNIKPRFLDLKTKAFKPQETQ